MMFCTRCGSKVDEAAVFCENCGCRLKTETVDTTKIEPAVSKSSNKGVLSLKCPQCGANMTPDEKKELFRCEFCGYQMVNVTEKVNVTHSGVVLVKQDRSNDPNLVISFTTSNPSVNMVTRIVATGEKSVYVNGTTTSFHLSPGTHEIILKIGSRNYSRIVTIPQDNTPVKIAAGFARRAFINIDQPLVTDIPAHANSEGVSFDTGANNMPIKTAAPSQNSRPHSPWSIGAFVCSLTMVLAPLAAALAVFDLVLAYKKKDEKKHVFSYIAIGISVLGLLYLLGRAGA